MYHIKNDNRALRSAQLIYDGLVECMKRKEFDSISVSNVLEISKVGRATFYRAFDSLIDVLYWKCNMCFREVLTDYISQEGKTPERDRLLHYFFDYWMKKSDIIEYLLKINRIDIIFECHSKNSHIISEHFMSELEKTDAYDDYFMAIRTGIFIGLFLTWVKKGKKESTDELVALLVRNLDVIWQSKILL